VKLKEAEILFNVNALQEPVITKQEGGWIVTLEGSHKLNPTLETSQGHVRLFKKLDAAAGVLFEVGFSEVKIIRKEC